MEPTVPTMRENCAKVAEGQYANMVAGVLLAGHTLTQPTTICGAAPLTAHVRLDGGGARIGVIAGVNEERHYDVVRDLPSMVSAWCALIGSRGRANRDRTIIGEKAGDGVTWGWLVSRSAVLSTIDGMSRTLSDFIDRQRAIVAVDHGFLPDSVTAPPMALPLTLEDGAIWSGSGADRVKVATVHAPEWGPLLAASAVMRAAIGSALAEPDRIDTAELARSVLAVKGAP